MPDSPAREQSDVTGSLVLAGCVHGYYGRGVLSRLVPDATEVG